MQAKFHSQDFQEKQYFNHANIVYISTFAFLILFLPIFIYINNLYVIIANIITLFSSAIAIYLNQKKRFGIASFIFITALTIQAAVETYVFGFQLGFQYYFFNMSVLIIYTNWHKISKYAGVFSQIFLFVLLYFLTRNEPAMTVVSSGLMMFFHTINIVLNIIGVANSSYYYLKITINAQSYLKKLATTDYLTEIPNRTGFSQYYESIKDQDFHKHKAMGILMMDVDHFKNINDTYGHMCGDYILKEIASVIKKYEKENDMVARYGGEEFVFVIHNISYDEFVILSEGLRVLIEKHDVKYQQHSLNVTISIGAVYCRDHDHEQHDLILEKADQLLYEAKKTGRNKVVFEDCSDLCKREIRK